jgi:hypothetical protein
MSSQSLLLKASGLYTFPNRLSSIPKGALLRALNIVINRDNVIECRRGFKLYGGAMGGSSNTAHQLLTYKERVLRHYGTSEATTLQFDNGSGTFTSFTGTFNPVASGLRIKGIEANSNFYFTTDAGIKKISVSDADDLAAGSVTSAGAAKGLDLFATLDTDTGFFTQESTVAYRILWGIKDSNQNLILGTPSERVVIYNPLTDLLVTDFNALLAVLDTCNFTGGISDANYVATLGIPVGSTASTVRTKLIALATKIDADTVITSGAIDTASASVTSNVASLVFNSSVATFLEVGDQIIISGLTGAGTTADLNGTRTILSVSTTTITFALTHGDFVSTPDTGGAVQRKKYTDTTRFPQPDAPTLNSTEELEDIQAYYNAIVEGLQTDPAGICTGSAFNSSGATESATVNLTFTIPDSVTTAWFYQIYRTQNMVSDGVTVLSSLDPGEEFQLAYESNPTSAEISTGYLTVQDVTPESFLGANLYTNPNTGEGILQANEVPPLAKDIALFKGYTFYANTKTKQRMNIALLSVSDLVADTSTLTISDGTTSNTYTFSSAENISTKKVLISTADTPAQQVDETARSLERVINRNSSENVYCFYLSGADDVPGLLLFEGKDLSSDKFYVTVNNAATAGQFNPVLPIPSPISSITVANPTVVTDVAHGLVTNDQIFISGSNSTPSIDGVYTITRIDADTFTIPVNVTILGNRGGWVAFEDANASDNEEYANRIYYSKVDQPEAVPIVNYVDVGPRDKEIVRILPLRDSLMILKEEGVYRLSGLVAPFTVSPSDSSANIVAADSAAVLNNLIYCFTTQGIAQISDANVTIISRPIEDKLLKLNTPQYTNFATATWAIGYEDDRTYNLWTVTDTSDTLPTQYFRYNSFTNSWTEGDKTARAGIINPADGKMYLAATDTNYIEQERKTFDRTDYADREYADTIAVGDASGYTISLGSVNNMYVGDVVTQTQYLTINKFNQLLTKLDNDPILTDEDYSSTLAAETGSLLSDHFDDLIAKIAADAGRTGTAGATAAGSYTALAPVSTTFSTLQTVFNSLITLLNADPGVGYNNYTNSTGTVLQEVIITEVDDPNNILTTQYAFPFIAGPITIYNSINCEVEWVPESFGDVSSTKQVSEATVIFEDSSYSTATVSFASDLSPSFFPLEFEGFGNGAFGLSVYGEGIFGGNGSGVPFRTLVPKDKQRCRYALVKFEHAIARESFSLYGISLTFTPISQRGYR